MCVQSCKKIHAHGLLVGLTFFSASAAKASQSQFFRDPDSYHVAPAPNEQDLIWKNIEVLLKGSVLNWP